MIKLFGFGKALGVIDPSPFVVKINVYLRMANIEFESVNRGNNLQKSPKGKLPFIIDGDKTIADSEFIIDYLQKNYHVDLDKHLSAEEKSMGYLFGKTLDESLYWCIVYSRWIREETWPEVKQAFFSKMPFPFKFIIPIIARSGVRSTLKKQGFGRHTDDEILEIAKAHFQALSSFLGEKTYFFGDNPSTFDASAYGLLTECIETTINNSFNDTARSYPNLVNYCATMKKRYYPDS
jgi:glutathione S-transferase